MTTGALTDQIRGLIGTKGERVQESLGGIERDDLRRFTQAIMDPDPRYWDEAFARTTRYGGVVTPPIYCTYLSRKTPAGVEDPVARALGENPQFDGSGSYAVAARGGLPLIQTNLKRVLNAGNEIEVYKYPQLGDVIFSQARYADITERAGRDGAPMLIVITEITYTDQDGAVLCILRSSVIRR